MFANFAWFRGPFPRPFYFKLATARLKSLLRFIPSDFQKRGNESYRLH